MEQNGSLTTRARWKPDKQGMSVRTISIHRTQQLKKKLRNSRVDHSFVLNNVLAGDVVELTHLAELDILIEQCKWTLEIDNSTLIYYADSVITYDSLQSMGNADYCSVLEFL